ncbi:MAG: hypothetical protein ACOY94_20600 [Bacillota bacterium]
MQLQELRQELLRRIEGGRLRLDSQRDDFPVLANLYPLCPGGRLALWEAGVELVAEGEEDSLQVTGTWEGAWPIPGSPEARLEDLRWMLTLRLPDPNEPAHCLAWVRGFLQTPAIRLAVVGNNTGPRQWSFSHVPDEAVVLNFGELMKLVPKASPLGRWPAELLSHDAEVSLSHLSLEFDPNAPLVDSLSYVTGLPQARWELLPGSLSLSMPELTVAAERNRRNSFDLTGQVSGTVGLSGIDYVASVGLGQTRGLLVSIYAAPGAPPLTLAHLGGLVGAREEFAPVEDALSQAGFKGLQLSQFLLGVELEEGPKVAIAEVGGQLFLGDVALEAGFRYPEFAFGARLAQGSELDLRRLVGHFIPEARELPELKLSDLSLEIAPRSRRVWARGALHGDWTLPVGNTHAGLTGMGLELVAAPGGVWAQVTSWAKIGRTDCYATIALPSLELSLGLQPGSQLNLTRLAGDLLPQLALPADLPEVAVSHFRLAASPRKGSFALEGQAVAGGDGLGVNIGRLRVALKALDLGVARREDGRGEVFLGGACTVGGADFYAGLRVPAGEVKAGLREGSALSLKALVEALLPSELTVPADLPEVTLTDLTLTGSHAESTLHLTARAKVAAPGLQARLNRLEVAITEMDLEIRRLAGQTVARLHTEITVDGAPFAFEFRLPGPSLKADLAEGATFHLSRAVERLLPQELTVPAGLPQVHFNQLHLEVGPGAGVFAFKAASPDTWPIPLGQGLSVGCLHLEAETRRVDGRLVPSGELGGRLSLGGTNVDTSVRLEPGELLIRTSIDRVRLFGLLESVLGSDTLQALPVPKQVWELELTELQADLAPLAPRLLASAKVPGFERIFVLVQGKGEAGFVAGLIAAPEWRLSQLIPELSPLDGLRLDRTYVIVSSIEGKADLPADLTRHLTLDPQFRLHRGVMFSANLDLSRTEALQWIEKVFAVPPRAGVEGVLDLQKIEESYLKARFGAFSPSEYISFNGLELFLKAAGQVSLLAGVRLNVGKLQPTPTDEYLEFVGALGASLRPGQTAVYGMLALRAGGKDGIWYEPLGIPKIALVGVGLSVAAGQGVNLALKGAIRIGDQQTGLRLQAEGAITNFQAPSMLGLKIASDSPAQSVTLPKLFTALTELELPQNDEIVKILNSMELRKLGGLLVLTPTADPLDPTRVYDQGLALGADVTLLSDYRSEMDLAVYPAKGIKAAGSLSSAIRLGDVLLISDADKAKGPRLKLNTIDGFSDDFLQLSGHVSLFNLARKTVDAKVNGKGFRFFLEDKVEHFGGVKFDCQLDGIRSFGATASLNYGLQGGNLDVRIGELQLCTIRLPTLKIRGETELRVGLAEGFKFKVDAYFHFNGKELAFSFEIDKSFQELAELIQHTVRELAARAWEILKPALAVAEQLFEAAKQGLLTLGEDVGRLLKEVYEVAAKEAARLLRSVGWGAQQLGSVLKDVYHQAADDVAKLMKDLGLDRSEVGQMLVYVFQKTAEEADKLLDAIGWLIGETTKCAAEALDRTIKPPHGPLLGADEAPVFAAPEDDGLGGLRMVRDDLKASPPESRAGWYYRMYEQHSADIARLILFDEPLRDFIQGTDGYGHWGDIMHFINVVFASGGQAPFPNKADIGWADATINAIAERAEAPDGLNNPELANVIIEIKGDLIEYADRYQREGMTYEQLRDLLRREPAPA